MENRVLPRKRRKLVFRTLLQMVLPSALGGFLLGLIITFDLQQALYFLIFGTLVALLSVIFNNLNRILYLLKLKRLSFRLLQFVKFVTETLFITFLFGFYVHFKYDYHILSKDNILSKDHINLLLLALLGSAVVSYNIGIMVLFNRIAGQQVLQKYFSGKYHIPKEVERIFMFIDLKGSTTIAEQIGHIKFFSLINDLLFDISDAVIENDGEIYKYMGDEIIITWSLKKGLNHNNCINLYFDIHQKIRSKQDWYFNKYGIIPKFKAGVHVGKVIIGELGDYKSEIAYMGDAVNTSARIQAQCNALNAKLLISKELLEMLVDDGSFKYEELDKLRLKGKLTDTVLIKVEQRY